MKRTIAILALALACALLTACAACGRFLGSGALSTPEPTPEPTAEPTQGPTAEPTSEPTVWTCIYCGKVFGSSDKDYDNWYYHAWVNPGCYEHGHAVTPAPTPTPTPSHPEGNGHWEDVWVVDVPKVCHDVWHCNACGYESTVWYGDFAEHQDAHAINEGVSGYHSYTVIDQEEIGHWEHKWVPDP